MRDSVKNIFSNLLPARYLAFAACNALFVIAGFTVRWNDGWWWGAAIFGALSLLGLYDIPHSRYIGPPAGPMAYVVGSFTK